MVLRLVSAISFVLLLTASFASGAVIYQNTLTGAQMDQYVQNSLASYPAGSHSVSGNDLTLSGGGLLYRLPMVAAGVTDSYVNVEAVLTIDYTPGSGGDNDPGFGITNGARLVGANQGDQNVLWTMDSTDTGTGISGENWSPSAGFVRALPMTLSFDFEDTFTALHVENNIGSQIDFSIGALDHSQSMQIFLYGDGDTPYIYHSIGITITGDSVASGVPEPATLALVGLGMLGLAARRK